MLLNIIKYLVFFLDNVAYARKNAVCSWLIVGMLRFISYLFKNLMMKAKIGTTDFYD